MISKDDAGYIDVSRRARMGEECGTCSMYRPGQDSAAGTCTLVRGRIEFAGWCRHWEAKAQAD